MYCNAAGFFYVQVQSEHDPSIFKDDGHRIKIVGGPNGPDYPLYLMVNKNISYIMATSNISEATEFYQLPANFSKQCPP